jgi:hypothetical protein
MKHVGHLFMFSVALIVSTCSAHGATVVTTTLLGSKLVPPIASTATGRAVATLQGDNKTLEVDVTFVGLTGSATAALIHCCGSPGVNALVAVTLPGFPSTTSGHYVNTFDLSVAATYNSSFITAHGGTVESAKAAFITALKTGQTYITIHDAAFPAGEIRGQLAATNAHDFNGSGQSDILWRDTSGMLALWFMNGAAISSAAGAGTVAIDWSIVGQRDFNSDGTADVLWRNTSGQVAIWLMNGATVSSAGSPGTVATDWTVAGTGDFDGDGFGDILWRNTTSGQVAIWLMSGTTISSAGSPGTVTTDWMVAGTGDFDGDGKRDIVAKHHDRSGGNLADERHSNFLRRRHRHGDDRLDRCWDWRLQRR